MSKSNIKKWCKALRSGKYKQSFGSLQNANGYCCLGVACDIFIDKKDLIISIDHNTILGGFPVSQSAAPEWLKCINDVFDKITSETLSSLNDNRYSFDEIADVLEAVYIHEVLD